MWTARHLTTTALARRLLDEMGVTDVGSARVLFVGSMKWDGQKTIWLQQIRGLDRARFDLRYVSFMQDAEEQRRSKFAARLAALGVAPLLAPIPAIDAAEAAEVPKDGAPRLVDVYDGSQATLDAYLVSRLNAAGRDVEVYSGAADAANLTLEANATLDFACSHMAPWELELSSTERKMLVGFATAEPACDCEWSENNKCPQDARTSGGLVLDYAMTTALFASGVADVEARGALVRPENVLPVGVVGHLERAPGPALDLEDGGAAAERSSFCNWPIHTRGSTPVRAPPDGIRIAPV